MADKTGIEWTEATWNPITGCDRVSEGCDHCYAATLAKRLKAMGNPRYQRDGDSRTSGPGFGVTLHHDQIPLPLRWRHPRVVFVNSMSDLFHDAVPVEFIEDVFAVMAATPRHTFQILTKRPGRMASVLNRQSFLPRVHTKASQHLKEPFAASPRSGILANVWLGTSVENQKWANVRIPKLLDTPSYVRFLSCEPLLDALNLEPWISAFDGRGIHWVIVGGESGPGARPMNPRWVRSLLRQCTAAEVPFFLKQWGGRTPKAGGRQLDGRTWDEMPSGRAMVPAR
jgi:protein gp37